MEFPARNTKSKIYCCVFGCRSKACRDEKIKFFHIPHANQDFVDRVNKFGDKEKIDRRAAWINVLKIGKSVTASMRVCSLHFIKDDFLPSPIGSTRSYLKKTSVPSQNLPLGSTEEHTHYVDSREERIRRRSLKKKMIADDIESISYGESKEKEDSENAEEEKEDDGNEEDGGNDLEFNESYATSVSAKENASCSTAFKDIGIQVQSDLMIPKFSNLMTSKEELSALTGIPTFELLHLLEELVATVRPVYRISSRFDLREMILMTFIKLKQNLSYAVLAVLFKCSNDTCRDIIVDMIDNLYLCLKPAIYWPTKDNILRNMPECFEDLEIVRVVIDCTEIPIQRPSKLCGQLQTYSYYKSTYTVKFMTGVTPAGLISVVSKPYGGRVSDNMIFEQSELLKKNG